MEYDADGKPCRACTSVADLMKKAQQFVKKKQESEKTTTEAEASTSKTEASHGGKECPVDKDELGRSTWNLLHTISVYYPEKPSEEHKKTAATFLETLSKTYPCDFCAKDLRKDLRDDPPRLGSRSDFAEWMCQLHNKVNRKTGKPEFDCSKVFERWKDGWKDGSCDF